MLLQAGLLGSSAHGGVQPEAGAGVQRLSDSDSPHCSLQGCALFTQTHQGERRFLLMGHTPVVHFKVEENRHFVIFQWNHLE